MRADTYWPTECVATGILGRFDLSCAISSGPLTFTSNSINVMRIACTTLLVTLVSLVGCADKNSRFAGSSGPQNTSQGGDPILGSPGADDSTPTGARPTDPADNPNHVNSSSTPVSSLPHDGRQDPPEPVPEPGTILLFGLGLTGLAIYRRRRRGEEREASIA